VADTGEGGSGRKWLACGCGGCLVLLAIVLLLLAMTFGRAWLGVRNEQVVDRTLEPEIRIEAVEEAEETVRPGQVVLRLRSGEFRVRPADPGEPLRVDARYDERSHELRETYEPAGDDGWVYRLDFEGKGSWWLTMLKAAVGGTGARVDVYLPRDVPLDLEIDGAQGGVTIDLGGLWLTRGAVEMSQGGIALEVSEPLREPMESFAVSGSMGGGAVVGLGNLSPRRLDLEWKMGGVEFDLRGEWVTDSEISIETRQGGAAVRLPRGVNLVGIDQPFVRLQEPEELPRPTLTFSVSAEQGELEFYE
jgi:hypothetical protein